MMLRHYKVYIVLYIHGPQELCKCDYLEGIGFEEYLHWNHNDLVCRIRQACSRLLLVLFQYSLLHMLHLQLPTNNNDHLSVYSLKN